MANRFSFVGKIVPCKESDSFKPYSVTKFDSGWAKTAIRFNIVCGTNRHLLESSCLTPENIKDATIYTYAKGAENSDGSKEEGKNIQVPYADRKNPDIVAQVPYYKKFIVDIEFPNRRYELEHAIDKFKDGSITDEEMTKLGIKTIEECETAYETSKQKRHEFIWEYDFIEYLNKFVNNPKIKDMLFHIKGEYVLDYSEKDGKWYRHLKPTSIYRCNDDEKIESSAEFQVVFDNNAVDDSDFEETGKIHLNLWVGQYLGKPYKATKYAPMTFNIVANKEDEKSIKMAKAMSKRFKFPDDYEGEYREYGIKAELIDGAPIIEISMDNLTEEQRENIEMGWCTLEDIKRELGKPMYGDKVQEMIVTGFYAGYTNGSKDTTLTADDVTVVMCALESAEVPFADEEDDDDDDII